jgi:hypothetical protein
MSSVNNCKTYTNVALLSETHLKPYERFLIPNYHFYRTDRFLRREVGTAIAVRKGIPHKHVDLPPLVPIKATGVWIPIGNSDMSRVCKPPGHEQNDTDIA